MRYFKEMVLDDSAQTIPTGIAAIVEAIGCPPEAATALAGCVTMASSGLAPATMGIMVGRPVVFRTGSKSATMYVEKGDSEFRAVKGEPMTDSKTLTIEADNPGDIMSKVRPLVNKNPIKILPLLLSGKVKIGGSVITALRFRRVMKIARAESERQRKELYGF